LGILLQQQIPSRASAECPTSSSLCALKASLEENAASFHFCGHNRGHAAPSSLTQLIGKRLYAHDLYSILELENLFFFQGPIV